MAELRAGVGKVDITHREACPVNDPLHARALVLTNGQTTLAIITVDAVAIGEIGTIRNDYLPNVRSRLQSEFSLPPANVLINASHCHGIVCRDVELRTVQAVRDAMERMTPVRIGAGRGYEDRIMENRRLLMKDGTQIDVRRAYALPPDEDVAEVGPVDPEIGILRLDRIDGRPLAVVYNFACHPIQGVPSQGNTADITGFASKVIEDNLGEDSVAMFLQGCAGDINPVFYKDVDHPRDAETLGNLLGLSTLQTLRKIPSATAGPLKIINEFLELPRADTAERILAMEAEQQQLLQSLNGTSLNLKTFLNLFVKYNVSGEFGSYDSHRYLHDRGLGRQDLIKLDEENRINLQSYIANIHMMERLTRLQTNLTLLRKHQATNQAAEKATIDVELGGLRVGDFVLITFPGELVVEIGRNIKKMSPHKLTFVAGYTNGYIYYTPTTNHLENIGRTQEDSDCLVAPEWQPIFEAKVRQMLKKL